MKKTTILLVALIAIVSCTKKSKYDTTEGQVDKLTTISQEIKSPFPDIKPKATTYTINTSEESVLITELGSKITIPKNAFVDANGKVVKGEVKISFQEYHTAEDVILSGIPMHILSEKGELEAFETAGMFDISGADIEGNEVRVGGGKTLSVELATFKKEENFNFYELDKETSQWTELYKNTEVQPNVVKNETEGSLQEEPVKPVEIRKASSSDLVFELAVNKQRNPEFSSFDNVLWKLADSKSENAQLFKETIKNPVLNCIDRVTSTFSLTGMAGDQKIDTKVQPVLFGRNWKKAQASFRQKLSTFNAKVKERKQKMERVNKMAKLQRNLRINKFGTYNCDRYSRMPGRKKIHLSATFLLPVLKKTVKEAYLIIKKGLKKEAIPLNGTSAQYFIYAPHENNTLITFDSDGTLYEFTNDDFQNLENMKLKKNAEYTFRFMETGYKVTAQSDLKSYLEQL